MIKIELVHEFELEPYIKVQISALLKRCFPEEDFNSRTYFKQHPHSRLLLSKDDVLIGQLGLDYRAMNLNGKPIHVLGIIDLAIFPEYQGQGYASRLIHYLNDLAFNWSHNIDFLFLYSEETTFYEKFGFSPVSISVEWLAMQEHRHYGVMIEKIHKGLMYKPVVGQKIWPEDSKLDLLGYFY
ncbi:GNAT family N-acetyltransferase [Acinetobacter shaoyimingii]|uniref:GNAT family N-acetyltransferase n=1 Tax=Acinetobacter shaoyimingii TaxID=2715164 RepID=A0A6G8RY37_9GAMM|nr:GNAT family N-acetyltransferase [Acinetobacter shaoyimingii]QIO06817.1 GNAT family N-acetyltransferase [Acinetobacter shaoyimingii]